MKKLAAISSAISYLALTTTTFAQNRFIQIERGGLPGYQTISEFINAFLRLIFIIALLAVLVMLVWGAMQWIFSGGEKEAVEQARNRILHALIGLAVLAVAFALVVLAGEFVGINLLGQLPIPRPGGATPTILAPVPGASPI